MDPLERLVAVQAIRDLVVTYSDGVRRPRLEPPQNFENTILARHHDDVVREGERWLFRRREEIPLEHRAGPPPMSDTAMSVSSETVRG